MIMRKVFNQLTPLAEKNDYIQLLEFGQIVNTFPDITLEIQLEHCMNFKLY